MKSSPSPPLDLPRRFSLYRWDDISGVSGTGTVAYGIQFPDGHCAVRWNSGHASTNSYDCIEDIETTHGHRGATEVKWID